MEAILGILTLIITILVIVGLWMMFTKAGKPGWYSLIPILNVVALIDIAGKPWWWIFGFFIPFVNVVVIVLILHGISRGFGQDWLFTVGMIFLTPIMYMVLGFGNYQYSRPT